MFHQNREDLRKSIIWGKYHEFNFRHVEVEVLRETPGRMDSWIIESGVQRF